jgi:Arc/MetJ-type ribon-helix-helix transcriptional regulator
VVTTPSSFRPDEETERALRALTADGRSRGEVIREAVLRLYREDFIHRCAEDARRLADDPDDAVHMRRIAAEMRELNAW